MAQELALLLGKKRHLIELGVGSGLMAEVLIKQIPDLVLTGIDFSSALLEQARQRLGNAVQLIEEDVLHMNLGVLFEAAYSSGGVWCLSEVEQEYWLYSHLPEMDDNVQGLQNVARHLKKGGTLFLSVQENHENKTLKLSDNVVYSQDVKDLGEGCIDKNYFFMREGVLIAQHYGRFRFFNAKETESFLNECGFEFKTIGPQKRFLVYQTQV